MASLILHKMTNEELVALQFRVNAMINRRRIRAKDKNAYLAKRRRLAKLPDWLQAELDKERRAD